MCHDLNCGTTANANFRDDPSDDNSGKVGLSNLRACRVVRLHAAREKQR
ncbi:hypothetical protein GBAR_LOCUS22113 [Geodia barretti]|uniref:Uncharacterized protein n=1 Tax=Geodia barretti TaxID=519541 RepID=A0AA35T0U3_GEOBA|nr:hypothetical protein GBAR_LOCUS22113 [Geodia barretti]